MFKHNFICTYSILKYVTFEVFVGYCFKNKNKTVDLMSPYLIFKDAY